MIFHFSPEYINPMSGKKTARLETKVLVEVNVGRCELGPVDQFLGQRSTLLFGRVSVSRLNSREWREMTERLVSKNLSPARSTTNDLTRHDLLLILSLLCDCSNNSSHRSNVHKVLFPSTSYQLLLLRELETSVSRKRSPKTHRCPGLSK